MTLIFRASPFLATLLVTLTLFAGAAGAQTLPSVAPAENGAATAAKPEKDPYGRETPQGMVVGLMNALAAADYARALRFFEIDSVPGVRRWYVLSGSELASRAKPLGSGISSSRLMRSFTS